MTLNVQAALSESAGRDAAAPSDSAGRDEAAASGSDEREALVEQLLGEVTTWTPRDQAGAFKRWHQGALSLVHLSVLSTLQWRGPQPMGVLADELDVSMASATGIIDRMEKRGLVEREHAADDRRVVLVKPTEAGLELVRTIGRRRRDHLEAVLHRLDETQLGTLLTALRTLHAAMDEQAAAMDERAAALGEGNPA